MTASIPGLLHIFVAFDWGDEIRLDRVGSLIAAKPQDLARRRRTPPSVFYRPPPSHVDLGRVPLHLAEVGDVSAAAGVTLFDFGAVSLAFRVPVDLAPDALRRLAGSLAEPGPLLRTACEVLRPIYRQLLPAVVDPSWQEDFSEEYFVFQLPPEFMACTEDSAWVAGLVHLESDPIGREETVEALRYRLSYSPCDLLVADWTAALLVDRDCEETLQAIEFANLQLLEYRHIDTRLDVSLAEAARTVQPRRSFVQIWRRTSGPLNRLGVLKVEAEGLFERTSNVLKLIGDSYLARVYRLVAKRFYLETWMESIQRKLEVAEGIYQVVSDQASTFRLEFLEIVVVVLILIEIVLALVHR